MGWRARTVLAVGLAAGWGGAGCGGAGDVAAPETPSAQTGAQCTVPGQNQFVRTTMRDIYLWYRELPDPDTASFSSPEAYLEAVRYRALDSSYSFITGRAENDAFYSESQFIGFGFGMTLLSADELRVTEVYPGSPAAEAGLQRGAQLLAVNGRTISSLVSAGELNSIFGASQVGVSAQVRFSDRSGAERDVQMTKRVVTIPTASLTRTFASGGRAVGYVHFRNFVTPSTAALNEAFAELEASGANDLVLDLRYNGGGLVSVAQHLGGLIGGARTRDRAFVQFVHNDKNTGRNSTLNFPSPAHALGLERLVVIATRSSASASELVVNGLRPFVEVTVVGERTYGKPVGQYGYNFCDKVLYPVAFSTQNARGEGDFFDGIPADCAAPDDLGHDLGDGAEGSLAEALRYLRTGRCSAVAAADARAQSARRPGLERQPRFEDGWQALLGAY
ncbi:MAG TPA: S41 family peptidase [Vicinamibacteria bacterium]|nr:S41 family peptidase [Vicinamibacteria bacterium]